MTNHPMPCRWFLRLIAASVMVLVAALVNFFGQIGEIRISNVRRY